MLRVGHDRLVVHLLPDGRHDQQRKEKGQRRDDLRGRQVLRAERLTQQTQHDDDANVAGGHQQRGRRQTEHGQQQHDLQAGAKPFGAGPRLRSAGQALGQPKRRRLIRGLTRRIGGDGGGGKDQAEHERQQAKNESAEVGRYGVRSTEY